METIPKKPTIKLSPAWNAVFTALTLFVFTFAVAVVVGAVTRNPMPIPMRALISWVLVTGACAILFVYLRVSRYLTVRWIKSISGGSLRKHLEVWIDDLEGDEVEVHMSEEQFFKLGTYFTSVPNSPAALAAVQVVADMMRTTSPQRVKYSRKGVTVKLEVLKLSESDLKVWMRLNEIFDQLAQENEEGYMEGGGTFKQLVLDRLDSYATKTEEKSQS